MSLLIVLLSLVLAGVATFLFAKASRKELRSRKSLRVALRMAGFVAAEICLLLICQIYPTLQAVFIWLGVISLAATVTVFLLPKFDKVNS
ncbi:hypothetical protein R50073_21030 [Maricurvus nonylphenolicus]|uniref:hypothetical protein n=1 Tax=Maricurvus nonylphenolicus TaxID=1008307 RepID=UPI0036F3380A